MSTPTNQTISQRPSAVSTRPARGGRHLRAVVGACLCWTAGIAAMLVFVLLVTGMLGCSDPRADFRGEQVTESELAARVEAETARLAREAADREAAFKIAVAKLDGQRAIDIAELTARYEADSRLMADAQDALVRDRNAATASIENEWAKREGWAGAAATGIQTASSLFPAFTPFAGIAAGAIGLLGWRRNANKAEAASEAVRAITVGVASLPKAVRSQVKSSVKLHADRRDRDVIAKIVAADELAAVESEVDNRAA